MLKLLNQYYVKSLSIIIILSVSVSSAFAVNDPLPAWRNGPNKQRILNFIRQVTSKNSKHYVPAQFRIATFDADGTLWSEKPTYPQLAFSIETLRPTLKTKPKLRLLQPYKATWQRNYTYFFKASSLNVVRVMLQPFAGISQKTYVEKIKAFLNKNKHPRYHVSYLKTVYQPMKELIRYLKENKFKVYIVTGSGASFIRNSAAVATGIPPEHVIGNVVKLNWQYNGGSAKLIRTTKVVMPFNDRVGKAININDLIGNKPIIAVGNTRGDLEMLQYAASNSYPSLKIVMHHDDAKREYAYDKSARPLLRVARQNKWVILSMANDFNQLFSWQTWSPQ